MRRTNLVEEEILKADPLSEVVLTASGIVLFSPLLVQSLQNWPNFVVFLAIDAGRKPPLTTI